MNSAIGQAKNNVCNVTFTFTYNVLTSFFAPSNAVSSYITPNRRNHE